MRLDEVVRPNLHAAAVAIKILPFQQSGSISSRAVARILFSLPPFTRMGIERRGARLNKIGPSRRGDTAPGEPEDAALVELAQRNPRAFEPLYSRYFDPVYRYAARRLGNEERAADATSQVFLKALAALPSYRAGSFRSWLFAIAHNVVIDVGQRATPECALPDDWDLSDPSPTPEEAAIIHDGQRHLAQLLAQLTPEQREVMELRLAGLSGQEIADQLGRGLAATKSIQWRALARLKRLLETESHCGVR